MSFLLSSALNLNFDLLQKEIREDIDKVELNSWNFYSTQKESFKRSDLFSVTDGYLRNLGISSDDLEAQLESCVRTIAESWPVPINITGSFSLTNINLVTEELIICTDPIGVYPLYYLEHNGHFFVSNSIIWLGAITEMAMDETGVFQRSFGPDFCNLGRRTILKNCKRLLPGEWIKFSSTGERLETKFDNSLYQAIPDKAEGSDLINKYWESLKKELQYCLENKQKVNLALSGGMDSRIILGAIASDKELKCLSYGAEKNYETKVARKLAKIKGAKFDSFHQPSLNFPSVGKLKEYTLKTEGVHLCSWLEILENVPENNEVLLIGDISTAVTGRTIKRFNSKNYQKKNFLKHTILNKGYDFEANTPESFKAWKDKITKKFFHYYNQKNIDSLGLTINIEDLRKNFLEDLFFLFQRIEAHNIPYIELVDELFTWYTHTRFPMGKQVLINSSKFQAYCPGVSIQMMRLCSSIPPEERLNLGFVRKLFRNIKELRKLSRIPTSQVPLVPLSAPHLLRIPVWGFRKIMDDYFIKKLVKEKDPRLRYRLYNSNNWVEAYQRDDLKEVLEGYFEFKYLGENYVNSIKAQAIKRKSLDLWPFANMNIMNAAALNTDLYYIDKMRGGNDI
ncbi:asparagine synthase-related protein [Christiangramia echinicola]|uniref:asparagine synthase (glutamine-hydrolyzing) n=1 Tax=Christiangramia echinicola TaxID=279359 RepID=A0A1H1L2U0_9FLAO|nr:asparagine synthase-related protein [Christiangramia echinicola]SDR68878.1 Asparagine synthase [Christiangramia echinicola]